MYLDGKLEERLRLFLPLDLPSVSVRGFGCGVGRGKNDGGTYHTYILTLMLDDAAGLSGVPVEDCRGLGRSDFFPSAFSRQMLSLHACCFSVSHKSVDAEAITTCVARGSRPSAGHSPQCINYSSLSRLSKLSSFHLSISRFLSIRLRCPEAHRHTALPIHQPKSRTAARSNIRRPGTYLTPPITIQRPSS